jgi:hypothetical protein
MDISNAESRATYPFEFVSKTEEFWDVATGQTCSATTKERTTG